MKSVKRGVCAARSLALVAALMCAGPLAGEALAQTPTSTNSISLQAKLTGVPDGTVNLAVKFYDALTGGTQVGSTITLSAVPVQGGIVSVPISPVDATVFNGSTRYMGIGVNGGAELSPRTLVTSVPYAMQTRGLFVDTSQRVGIGTTSPQQRCVVGTTISEISRMTIPIDEALTIGTSSYASGARAALLFETGNRTAAAIVAEKGIGEDNSLRFFTVREGEFATEKMTINKFGFVGIGASAPKRRLVVGTTRQDIDRLPAMDEAIVVGTANSVATTRVGLVFETVNRTAGAILVEKMNDGSNESSRMRFYVNQDTNPNAREAMTIREDGHVIVPGTFQTGVLTITGADVAEPFNVSKSDKLPEPASGMIVSIDPGHPGKLMVCSSPYDTKVAGAISGAGGLSVGIVMGTDNPDPLIKGDYPIAMSGRVYVWCDASHGAIAPGDRLTSSTTPGHAMKVTDESKAPGAVIGKAMTELKEGKGLVLVLVNLQ
jgi:hypothetical protein